MARKSAVILIDPRDADAYAEVAEADMRRFWSHRCKHYRQDGELFVDVGAPRAIRIAQGIERLKSFTIRAKRALRPTP